MILGMPARRIAVAGPAFSPLRLSGLTPGIGASFDGGYEWEKPNNNNTMWLFSEATRTAATAGKFAIRVAVGRTSPGSTLPPVCGLHYYEASESIGQYLGQASSSFGFWINDSGSNERTYSNATAKNLGNLTPARDWPSYSEVMIEVDLVNNRVWFGADGNWEAGANPATDTLPTYTLPGFNSDTRIRIAVVCDMYYAGGRVRLLRPNEFTHAATAGFTAGWPDP